jgi:subtilisin family serine protease
MMLRTALAAIVIGLAVVPAGTAARYAVGAESLADLPRLERALGGGAESLAPLPALVVELARAPRLRDLPGATYVERLHNRRLSFTPDDPLLSRQWHLPANRAFDYWPTLPLLPPVRVAVIDSGVDKTHPDLAGRIIGGKSFVGGSPYVDREGHGTFVAGLIAAGVGNAEGIAGMAPSAQLLVAKVVNPAFPDEIDVAAEAEAIVWAVDEGAKVINISLGGLRHPLDPSRDAYSQLEADAIAYARKRGAVIVAAVGNANVAPRQPWPFASYPAALPHVLGVSALARDGSSPVFSNRDKIYNDLAAPGQAIFSTLPRGLTSQFRDCSEQGYSACGPLDYRTAFGTSFAAPQVSAAAAVLLAEQPSLKADQVVALLTRTAADVSAASGCSFCPLGRDELTGWGRLDVTASLRALDGELPPRDRFEPNDDAGARAVRLCCQIKRVTATLDFWDDQSDVYAIKLRRGQPVYLSVRGPAETDTNLILWKPAATRVEDIRQRHRIATQAAHPGPHERLSYRARRTGWHFVQVKLGSRGFGRYKLVIVKA